MNTRRVLWGGNSTYVGIPLDGLLGHTLGTDMADQLGCDVGEHTLESLSGHGWWTLRSKEERRQGGMKFISGRTMFHTPIITHSTISHLSVQTTRIDSRRETN